MLLNINKIPDDFPQILIGNKALPLIYFWKGELDLFEREMDFRPETLLKSDRFAPHNLRTDLSFSIQFKAIQHVQRYSVSNPFLPLLGIDWIRLQLNETAKLPFTDLLISVGGKSNELKYIQADNNAFYETLKGHLSEIK